MTPERDSWGIQDAYADRAGSLAAFGFTDRQSRFLLTVLQHSGVFVERQYCRFAGIVHGQKTHDFIDQLVSRKLAREIQPGARHRGRLYHVHHKRLYAAIGEPDNRNRKRAPVGRMIERLMLLDAVLEDGSFIWLGTEKDKCHYCTVRLSEHELRRELLPYLAFGKGRERTLRLFPDKLPIGIEPSGHDHVLLYLLTRPAPVDFRAFLMRHFNLLTMLRKWTIRVVVPKPLAKAIRLYEHTFREELTRPIRLSECDELDWYFQQRRRADEGAPMPTDERFLEAARCFRAPRFRVLYRLWRQTGDDVVWNLRSTLLADKLERREGRLEFVVLARQYLHLSHLVGVA